MSAPSTFQTLTVSTEEVESDDHAATIELTVSQSEGARLALTHSGDVAEILIAA
jgi:hypothetical protein